jgi:hypothetical protein
MKSRTLLEVSGKEPPARQSREADRIQLTNVLRGGRRPDLGLAVDRRKGIPIRYERAFAETAVAAVP